jgi:UPF0716 family protein affecting phage T7 exclusion
MSKKNLPVLTLIIGLLSLVFMVSVEGEPGAIPLLLLLIGTIWYGINAYKQKTKQT